MSIPEILNDPRMVAVFRAVKKASGNWCADNIAFDANIPVGEASARLHQLENGRLVIAHTFVNHPAWKLTAMGIDVLDEIEHQKVRAAITTAETGDVITGYHDAVGSEMDEDRLGALALQEERDALDSELDAETELDASIAQASAANAAVAETIKGQTVTVDVFWGDAGIEFLVGEQGSLETFGAIHQFSLEVAEGTSDNEVANIVRQVVEQMGCDLCPSERPDVEKT